MDSNCRLLVEEMWQSYLCEENLDSFYESPPFGLHLDNPPSGAEALLQEDMDLVNEVLGVQDGWETTPEDFFGLMEEMLYEKQDDECNLCDQSDDQQDTMKETNNCKNTTENVSLTAHEQNEVMSNNHGTSKPKTDKRKKNQTTSAQNGKQKKKKTKTADKG